MYGQAITFGGSLTSLKKNKVKENDFVGRKVTNKIHKKKQIWLCLSGSTLLSYYKFIK